MLSTGGEEVVYLDEMSSKCTMQNDSRPPCLLDMVVRNVGYEKYLIFEEKYAYFKRILFSIGARDAPIV